MTGSGRVTMTLKSRRGSGISWKAKRVMESRHAGSGSAKGEALPKEVLVLFYLVGRWDDGMRKWKCLAVKRSNCMYIEKGDHHCSLLLSWATYRSKARVTVAPSFAEDGLSEMDQTDGHQPDSAGEREQRVESIRHFTYERE